MATLNELRRLAVTLPPSHRVQGSEVADVLSAVAMLLEHGDELLAAAQDGPMGVAQFLHDRIAAARPPGAEEPVKGQDLTAPLPSTPVTSEPSVQPLPEIDYDRLAAAIAAREKRNW